MVGYRPKLQAISSVGRNPSILKGNRALPKPGRTLPPRLVLAVAAKTG